MPAIISLDLSQIVLSLVCAVFGVLWRQNAAKAKALADNRDQVIADLVERVNALAKRLEEAFTPIKDHENLSKKVDGLTRDLSEVSKRCDAHHAAADRKMLDHMAKINNMLTTIRVSHNHIHPDSPIDPE